MATSIQRQLVVFDFDWSLADQDSDRWVFEVLAPELRRKMKTLKLDMQWTDIVALLLHELHDKGGSRDDIEGALRKMPFHPAMIRGVQALKAKSNPSTHFLCLSNANIVFISTILKDKGLDSLFDEVVTNPAEWDASGLLKLRRKIDPAGPQHQCAVGCSPNMCKGEELEAFLARHRPDFDRVIYVGDGSNDFCPILRLRSQDMVLCRRHRGLHKLITAYEGDETFADDRRVKAEVRYWTGAWEVEEIFGSL
ncbi:phosphatase phospho-type [Sparassis latifolia]|uniref:Phosphatase phospho-type n=1 Tax=Sparassis crispa TaxID=139825 RepID=A0A401GER4_9APHY|nr:hypothetical protein SCP_0304030 [Sparassis crispa]GBE80684.1 hypothetical protein SCP_0304030 [Sparassis crispa]